jgi:hypothetical protein
LDRDVAAAAAARDAAEGDVKIDEVPIDPELLDDVLGVR